jgi:4-methylaminobutanoate oxidase (formaldehyde-forming)
MEAGLGFAVSKEKDFMGRKALMDRLAKKKLVTIILEDPRSLVLGNEPVRISGRILGRVTSGGYGIGIASSIAFAYLPIECAVAETKVEILVFGEWIAGKLVKGPIYDPRGIRVRT